jgi:hypothetical protein
MEPPDLELPTPTIGAPPPEKLVADCPPIPPPNPLLLLLDPAPELTVEDPPVGLLEPLLELPPGPEEEPIPGPSEKPVLPDGELGDALVPPTVWVGWPETIDEAAPSPPVGPPPATPANG